MRIFATNSAAHIAGIKPAMRLSDARAICHQLQVRQHQAKADTDEMSRIACWLERYTPSVQIHGPDTILLDITGSAHLFGGENPMLTNLRHRLVQIGYTTRLGLADTIGAAFALVRYGEKDITIIAPDKLHQGLAFLPVRALRLSPEQADSLYGLGLKTIGNLFDIPRASLARRFSGVRDGASVLKRLDQALGLCHEPLQPQRHPPSLRFSLNPAEPCLHHDGIKAVFDILLDRLLAKLEREMQGLRKLSFRCFYTDGGEKCLSASFAKPCRVKKHIEILFNDQLIDIDPRFGLDGFVLSADLTDKVQAFQNGLLEEGHHQTGKLSELIDRLVNRLGKDAIFQVEGYQSHLPERAQNRVPVLQQAVNKPKPPHHPRRPITIFTHPETIEVIAEIPEGPPMRFHWRRVLRQVTRARGPERIAPEWWSGGSGTARTRDYYEVEDIGGQRYWLFRAGLYDEPVPASPPHWHIHGLFL